MSLTFQSQSSVLTDDEGKDAPSSRSRIERTTAAFPSQKKVDSTLFFCLYQREEVFFYTSLIVVTFFSPQAEHPAADDCNSDPYAAMQEEFITAVEEIRMGLERVSDLLCRTCQCWCSLSWRHTFDLYFVRFAEITSPPCIFFRRGLKPKSLFQEVVIVCNKIMLTFFRLLLQSEGTTLKYWSR